MNVWKYEIISRVEQDISLVRFAHSWDILVNTWNKFHISAHPCIILYLYNNVTSVCILIGCNPWSIRGHAVHISKSAVHQTSFIFRFVSQHSAYVPPPYTFMSLNVFWTFVLAHEIEAQRILSEATTLVASVYQIKHSTIQIELYNENAHSAADVCWCVWCCKYSNLAMRIHLSGSSWTSLFNRKLNWKIQGNLQILL